MAISKKFLKTKPVCKVTFEVDEIEASEVVLVGDFNDWDASANPLKKFKNGKFKTTIDLPKEQSFEFKYLADGAYFNDSAPDAFVWNEYAQAENSLLSL